MKLCLNYSTPRLNVVLTFCSFTGYFSSYVYDPLTFNSIWDATQVY